MTMRQLYISLSKYKQYWCKLIFWGYFPPFHWICRQNFAKKMMNCLHSFFLSMQIWNMNFEKCIDVLVGKSKTQLKCRDSVLIGLSNVYLCMTKVIGSLMASQCLSCNCWYFFITSLQIFHLIFIEPTNRRNY